MRHIAFVIPTLDRIGGAEQQTIHLAKGFAHRGWRVSVVALSGTGGSAAASLKLQGIAFHSLDMRKGLADPRGWIRFRQFIHAHQPEIVHAHLAHAALLARWSRVFSPTRVLVETIHSPATGRFARRIAYRATRWAPDVTTAVSRAAGEPWLASHMVRRSTLAIAPNGVDVNFWIPDDSVRIDVRKQQNLAHNDFVWLAVGRLEPVKDHSTLLRAFATLQKSARLIILGDGPLQGHLRRLSGELNLADRVRFLGFQSDVRRWMQASDGFVLSSRWEGLPIALIEACACALPSVVTEVPGALEVLANSPPQRSVPVGDAGTLASAMQELMSLPEQERLPLGRRARLAVCARFNLESVLDQWEELFLEALARSPHASRFGQVSRLPRTVTVKADM